MSSLPFSRSRACESHALAALHLHPVSSSLSASPCSSVSLSAHLASLPPDARCTPALARVLQAIADSVSDISCLLRSTNVSSAPGHSSNPFGDRQLNVDVQTHELVLQHLRASGVVATASSEEDPTRIDLSASIRSSDDEQQQSSQAQSAASSSSSCVGEVFSVSFDPLDGSSIIDANWSVGSIFSVWDGSDMIGQRVADQRAAAIAVYGPRTTLIIGLPSHVFELTLLSDGPRSVDLLCTWTLNRASMRIAPRTKTFAPANLRCAAEDEEYAKLVQFYIQNKYTLRYSGGLVPDFAHTLVKGSGVFLSPVSAASKAKLRLLYECAALSMISRWAGGEAVDEHGRPMGERRVESYDQRAGLAIGSAEEVRRFASTRQKGQKQQSSGSAAAHAGPTPRSRL